VSTAQQTGEVPEPVRAGRVGGDDAVEPVCDGVDAFARQRRDREVRDGVGAAQAEQTAHGGDERPGGGGVRLRLHEREHEIEQRIVELVDAVGDHADRARTGGAGKLEIREAEPEDRVLGVARRRRHVELDADRPEAGLARGRRARGDRDRRGKTDAAARRPEQERRRDGRAVLLRRAEQRNGE
jgi:hypothetical protein